MGSTSDLIFGPIVPKDHPHIHGEHHESGGILITKPGSPPYTWGALIIKCPVVLSTGITPIYMGSTGRSH